MEVMLKKSFDRFQAEIEHFHEKFPHVERFDLNKFFNPLADKKFDSSEELNAFIIQHLEIALDEKRQKSNHHFWDDLAGVWPAIAPLFGKIYANGGLTPESQKIFNEYYMPMLHRVSYGSPSTNMEKILLLAKEGIINFSTSSEVRSAGEIHLHLISQIDDKRFRLDTLIDARIPKTNIKEVTEGLYYRLLQKGEISLYQNTSTSASFAPGCVALDENGFIIAENGKTNTSIAAMGTPTEGVTYDNDVLSPSRNNFVSKWSAFVLREIKKNETHAQNDY